MPGRQLCFLSLDGGGVRGVSTLQVLKHLMETIAFDAQLDFTPKPCEYFDLIGGTSTGGLIAIMLGRLKMDVQECMDAYVDMSDQIFQKKHNRVSVRGKFQGRFDSDELERCIKKIIRDHGFDENELLKDLPDASCKVFVCATSTLTSDTVLLTSYRRRRGGNDRLRHIKIWEACRATSAATSFFDSIHIQMGNVGEDFVDGATGANNPVHFLWNEALDLWHSESLEANLKCLVSIGTGVPSIEPFKDGLLEIGNTLAQISTDTETVAESFQRSYRHLGQSGQYFRFNVRNGLQDIGLEDAAQKDTIVSKTQKYIESQETFEQMGRCIANLAEREYFCNDLAHKNYGALQKYRKPDDFSQLIERITKYDHERVHRRLSRKRLPGTTQWFLKHPSFKEWLGRKTANALWCSGIIGSGKTMIMTAAVEYIQADSQPKGIPTVYFYCEPDEQSESQGLLLLKSLIKQLLLHTRITRKHIPDPIVALLDKHFQEKSIIPDFDDLADLLSQLFYVVPDANYVLDGLDQLSKKNVAKLLGLIRQLFKASSQTSQSQILLCSRTSIAAPFLDIVKSIPSIIEISTTGNVFDDIQRLTKSITDEKMTYTRELTQNPTLLTEVLQTLLSEAKGMFLWVHLQIEILWETCFSDKEIRLAISRLPKTLEETYQRCLDQIDNQRANHILQWVCYATRPLTIYELREAISFDTHDQVLNTDQYMHPDIVVNCCANLIVLDPTDGMVRFAHPSAKQYYKEHSTLQNGHAVDGELRCGELCVIYLSFSNFGLQLSKPNTMISILPNSFIETFAPGRSGPFLSGLTKVLTPRVSNRPVKLPVHVPKSEASFDSDSYRFYAYASQNWAQQTRRLDYQSTVWTRFKKLALTPNHSWNIHPWLKGATSEQSHLHGLLGWAVKERHIPLLKLVLDVGSSSWMADLCSLPLPESRLPPLHLSSRLGFDDVNALLSRICDTRQRDVDRRTAFSHAAEKGHLKILEQLIAGKSGLKILLEDGRFEYSPLRLAIENKHAEVAMYLLSHVTDLKAISKLHRCELLHLASLEGQGMVVELLLEKGADTEAKAKYTGRTPLHLAAEYGHEAVAKLLLEKGANIEAKEKDAERTPLHLAAENGHEAVAKLLLEKGADIEAKDSPGWTPLHLAARNGREAVAKLLLEKGANIEAKEKDAERTPLHLAAEYGHEAVVKLLLEKGADTEAKDSPGWTPLHLAARNGHEAVAKLLLEKGADTEAKENYTGRTPLHLAARNGREAVAKLLLEKGANIEAKEKDAERTPLHLAAENGHEAVAKLLLEKGADTEAKDSPGWTPLHLAARNGHEAVVKLLLEKGADTEAKAKYTGRTPLHLAAGNGYDAVVKLLVPFRPS